MVVETDSHGRLYLSAELRHRYGEKFHVVEYDDRLELIPIDEDPLRAIRDAAGDAFEGTSIADLREEARAQATRDAREGFERDTRGAGDPDE